MKELLTQELMNKLLRVMVTQDYQYYLQKETKVVYISNEMVFNNNNYFWVYLDPELYG